MTHKPNDANPSRQTPTSNDAQPTKAPPLDRRTRRQVQTIEKRLDDNATWVAALFKIVLLLIAIQVSIWVWGAWRERQVESMEPIGTLHSMTAGSGWRGGSVIEVHAIPDNGSIETRFYPLDEPMAATQGTPLILETRANGELFICDAQRQACVRTAPAMLR